VLNNAERRLEIDDTLVDLHLEAVPGLGTYEKIKESGNMEYIPSPLGAFLVVIFRDLVGIRTGPLT
jgi:hypothetical protein